MQKRIGALHPDWVLLRMSENIKGPDLIQANLQKCPARLPRTIHPQRPGGGGRRGQGVQGPQAQARP